MLRKCRVCCAESKVAHRCCVEKQKSDTSVRLSSPQAVKETQASSKAGDQRYLNACTYLPNQQPTEAGILHS